jgi:hypothetical protein
MTRRLLVILKPLSKFALEVIYSPKITDWGMSYGTVGPNNLPVKFPAFCITRRIAVGLSTKYYRIILMSYRCFDKK